MSSVDEPSGYLALALVFRYVHVSTLEATEEAAPAAGPCHKGGGLLARGGSGDCDEVSMDDIKTGAPLQIDCLA